MATVYDYTFNNITRLGDDKLDLSQRSVQNSNASTYMLDNFRPACPMGSAIDFATSQPNVNFTGSHQVGIGGCNIDENSNLLLTSLNRPKCRISLLQRPFATVPYLGRGPFDPMMESKLQQTDTFSNNKKSVNTLSEVSFIPMSNYPLIPSIQKTITNPTYLVEGFVRGGEGTRKQ